MKDSPVFIFDLGKVLLDFDYSIAVRKLVVHSDNPPENLHGFLGESQWIVEYESGRMTRQEFFNAVRAAIGFRGDENLFGEIFPDIFTEIPAMTALHAEVRARGFQTFIFSNTSDLVIGHVRKNYPFFKNFDGYIFSYEIGAMKPEAKIYGAMEKLCGRRGADLIYLDDRPENIAAGAARGWQAILHESPEQTRAALVAAGILPP